MKLWRTTLILGFSVSLSLASCLPPTPTPTPTSTAIPTPTPTPTPTTIPTPTPVVTDVKISTPTDGDKVDLITTVEGTSQNIPDGSVIWVVVFLPSVGRFYPQNFPADVQVNGEWSSRTSIGQEGETGLKADILVVIADKSVQDQFNAYIVEARDKEDFAGMERLPDGAQIYDRVSVTRR